MAYEFAIKLAEKIERDAKLASKIPSVAGCAELELPSEPSITDIPGFPAVAAEIMEMKDEIEGYIPQVEELKQMASTTGDDAMRDYIKALILARRRRR